MLKTYDEWYKPRAANVVHIITAHNDQRLQKNRRKWNGKQNCEYLH